MGNLKIAAIYTGVTPELESMVNEGLQRQLQGMGVEIESYSNPGIINEIRDNGQVTPHAARGLLDMYERGVEGGAQVLFNLCSSVGEVAKAAESLYTFTGVKVIRIDEDMARQAVRKYSRIGVVATLRTTLEPTKRLLLGCAEELGKEISLVDVLADAFKLDQEQFIQRLIEAGKKIKDQVDVLVFAQGSMAYAEKAVSDALSLPVYSSIRFGVAHVRRAVDEILGGKAACEE